MTTLMKKSFDDPDDVKTPEKTHAATVNFGTVAATKIVAQPGWKWSECIKPHVGGESCQAGHVGMVLQGTIHVVSDDGSEITVTAGDAYTFAPGHDAWVVGDEEFIAYEFNNSGKDYAVWQSN
ncbi:MAG: cupin domain-containing protein [Arenicellales bacterium]